MKVTVLKRWTSMKTLGMTKTKLCLRFVVFMLIFRNIYVLLYESFQMDCYNIPLSRQHFSVATFQFQNEKPAKLEDCTVRMKPVVKHVGSILIHIISKPLFLSFQVEIDYHNGTDRDDGVKPGME